MDQAVQVIGALLILVAYAAAHFGAAVASNEISFEEVNR